MVLKGIKVSSNPLKEALKQIPQLIIFLTILCSSLANTAQTRVMYLTHLNQSL